MFGHSPQRGLHDVTGDYGLPTDASFMEDVDIFRQNEGDFHHSPFTNYERETSRSQRRKRGKIEILQKKIQKLSGQIEDATKHKDNLLNQYDKLKTAIDEIRVLHVVASKYLSHKGQTIKSFENLHLFEIFSESQSRLEKRIYNAQNEIIDIEDDLKLSRTKLKEEIHFQDELFPMVSGTDHVDVSRQDYTDHVDVSRQYYKDNPLYPYLNDPPNNRSFPPNFYDQNQYYHHDMSSFPNRSPSPGILIVIDTDRIEQDDFLRQTICVTQTLDICDEKDYTIEYCSDADEKDEDECVSIIDEDELRWVPITHQKETGEQGSECFDSDGFTMITKMEDPPLLEPIDDIHTMVDIPETIFDDRNPDDNVASFYSTDGSFPSDSDNDNDWNDDNYRSNSVKSYVPNETMEISDSDLTNIHCFDDMTDSIEVSVPDMDNGPGVTKFSELNRVD